MALQNRVDPWGRLLAVGDRGAFMGNRGGAIHDDEQRVVRAQASNAWITCVTEFKGRRREVMAPGSYTELFFLDEATALAAGHRPCFECRRDRATDFLTRWHRLTDQPEAKAPALDRVLAAERRVPRSRSNEGKLTHPSRLGDLPTGTVVAIDDEAWLVRAGRRLHRWTTGGYDDTRAEAPDTTVTVLTPPTTVSVLADGYEVDLHASA